MARFYFKAVRVCLGLIVGTVGLIAWTYGLMLLIGMGVPAYLNWPDLSHLPGGLGERPCISHSTLRRDGGGITGLWPAFLVGRWSWRKSAQWSRRQAGMVQDNEDAVAVVTSALPTDIGTQRQMTSV